MREIRKRRVTAEWKGRVERRKKDIHKKFKDKFSLKVAAGIFFVQVDGRVDILMIIKLYGGLTNLFIF